MPSLNETPTNKRRLLVLGLVFLIGLLTFGCTVNQEPASQIREVPPTLNPITTKIATATPLPISTPTMLPTASTIPSPTPDIEVGVYIPPEWTEDSLEVLLELSNSSDFQWVLVEEEENANLVISRGKGEYPYRNRVISLAVPFTSKLTDVTLEEAESVLEFGDPIIQLVELSDLRPDHRTLRVNGYLPFDSDYPLTQSWSIEPTEGYSEPAGLLSAAITNRESPTRVVEMAAVGDIMLDRSLGSMISGGDISFPFLNVQEILSRADLTFGNLESSLGITGAPEVKSYTFQAPPEAAESLAVAGFDILSLANNHALDFGPDALLEAIGLLDDQAIGVIGAGPDEAAAHQPLLLEINDVSMAFLGYVDVPVEVSGFDTRKWIAGEETPGLAWADPAMITEDVAEAAKWADVVIVSLHSGYEYIEQPSMEQIRVSRAAIDAGADLVIGHHSHLLQGIEFYNNGVIVYGLGNFAFEIDGDPRSAVLRAWINASGVIQLELIPVIVQFGGQPRLADSVEASQILQTVYRLTDLLNAQ